MYFTFQAHASARCAYRKPIAECLDAAIKQVFQEKPKDEIEIIDAGAGTGMLGIELQKLGYNNLHALDISQDMLNEAKKKKVPYRKFICAPLSDQRISEIETGEFDALASAGTLVKAHVRACAFVEMIRMVKIGKAPSDTVFIALIWPLLIENYKMLWPPCITFSDLMIVTIASGQLVDSVFPVVVTCFRD